MNPFLFAYAFRCYLVWLITAHFIGEWAIKGFDFDKKDESLKEVNFIKVPISFVVPEDNKV